mgnify:CR=1 FL=1
MINRPMESMNMCTDDEAERNKSIEDVEVQLVEQQQPSVVELEEQGED